LEKRERQENGLRVGKEAKTGKREKKSKDKMEVGGKDYRIRQILF